MSDNPQTFSIQTQLEKLQATMDLFLSAAHVDAVFGEPVLHEDHLIIPAAEVVSVMGMGFGGGAGNSPVDPQPPAEGEQPQGVVKMQSGEGGGGGGGGRVFSRGIAVVVASAQGVEVKPIIDVTKIALAAFTALGFVFAARRRMRRGKIS